MEILCGIVAVYLFFRLFKYWLFMAAFLTLLTIFYFTR